MTDIDDPTPEEDGPTPEERDRVMRAILASIDERLARMREEDARFEAWAALAVRLVGLPPEEKLAAIRAEGMTSEAWARLDEDYRRALSADMRAGLDERPARYAAIYKAEMARRRGAPEPSRSE